jgi:hypothetical protein
MKNISLNRNKLEIDNDNQNQIFCINSIFIKIVCMFYAFSNDLKIYHAGCLDRTIADNIKYFQDDYEYHFHVTLLC